jgi:excisionase family DNA binding protein
MQEKLKNKASGQNEFNYGEQRFSREESAIYLGVSVITVDRAKANGKLGFFRIGRRVVFGRNHLDEFLGRNEYKARIK